ncbi:uncharacterized protein LOC119582934 [Penaeus monodon]|uniref:uncharacterized protein LOC119582934 n=1 Tax=Penaeus monodon TaxID=6687 RepID=UPI0018A738E2|nr:uncharacterized protein LOC119582934 [Penaeus monodon]
MAKFFKGEIRKICSPFGGVGIPASPPAGSAGKVLGKVILKRLQESQSGFRSSRSTVDIVFTQRQLQVIEQNISLYIVFIDFTKASDTVNRECLWSLLRRYDCPEGIVSIIIAQVSLNGTLSEQFPVKGLSRAVCWPPLCFTSKCCPRTLPTAR